MTRHTSLFSTKGGPRAGLLFAGVLLLLHLLYVRSGFSGSESDPDRYFHFLVSKLYPLGEAPERIPQAEDVRWDIHFPEKEFLFHVFTGLGAQLGDDLGVLIAVVLMSSALLLSLYGFLGSLAGPWWAFVAVILPIVFEFSRYYLRLHMVRPHVLAMVWYVGMLAGALWRRPSWLALAAVGFALSYHGLQVPLLVGLAMAVASWASGVPVRRPMLYMVAGIMVGILINPHFPYQLVTMVQHLRIPLGLYDKTKQFSFGVELYPFSSRDFALNGLPFLMLFLWCGYVAVEAFKGRRLRLGGDHGGDLDAYAKILIALVLAGFILASAMIPRGFEYLGITASYALAITFADRTLSQRHRWMLVAALVVGSLYSIRSHWGGIKGIANQSHSDDAIRSMRPVMAAIPQEATGAKILNTNWSDAPYILYLRPDVRFSSLLDPTFLFLANADLYDGLDALNRGAAPDAFSLMRQQFKADYVLTAGPSLISLLEHDPHAIREYPKTYAETRNNPRGVFLFSLANTGRPEFVKSYRYQFHTLGSPPKPWPWMPDIQESQAYLWPSDPKIKDLAFPPQYFDLRKVLPNPGPISKESGFESTAMAQDAQPTLVSSFRATVTQPVLSLPLPDQHGSGGMPAEDTELCASVAIDPQEIERLQGATILGVGGGSYLRVFRNDRMLGHMGPDDRLYHTTGKMFVLDSPVTASDRFRVLACAEPSQPLGVSLSLWGAKELAALCDAKRYGMLHRQWDRKPGAVSEWSRLECLGPVERPV